MNRQPATGKPIGAAALDTYASPRVHARAWRLPVGRWFQPPETWTEPRPSVEQLWWYARHGKQAPESGVARTGLVAWGVVACAANALLYLTAWVVALPCYLGGRPPTLDVMAAARPSGREIWRAGWTNPTGLPVRTCTVLAVAVALALYTTAWTVARLSRSAAAGLLYVVFAHVIGLPWPSWLP